MEISPWIEISGSYYYGVILFCLQALIVEFGDEFTETAPLTLRQWAISIALGVIALPLGVLMRFIPVKVRLHFPIR